MELFLVLFLVALLAIPLGWLGVVTTPFGVDGAAFIKALGSLPALAVLIVGLPFWWMRCRCWASAQEKMFWRGGPIRFVVFLALLHWPLPLGAIVVVAVARLYWDRLSSVEAATESHTALLRILYAAALVASVGCLLF